MSLSNFEKPAPVHSRIRIPQRYNRQPIISRLVSRYNLTVNITAASLTSDSKDDGWFDLELSGNPPELTYSLSYLQGLGVDLMQLAIANQIKSKNTQPFPNKKSNLTRLESAPIKLKQEPIYNAIAQTNRVRLQLCILKNYYHKPIISDLVSHYMLTVNITNAMLNPDIQDDGWFDLDLWGRPQQLRASLNYLEKLELPLWLVSIPDGN
ncbi:NIL domain-containing protein [Plectonema radiosum NIES-515]|uniref:NIL domain-containing protein n=1 Tax=Plectonema radiosum NIES-515 TaxID=2986073 RepID=A0ABT3B119_9CYAN|nr:NIL domain-containing protein [Plectonema radiosum]MCV3215074.1 NIL domain-containing protein [Plectonema radiosum NIES-515]